MKYGQSQQLHCFDPANNPVAGFVHISPSTGLYLTQHFFRVKFRNLPTFWVEIVSTPNPLRVAYFRSHWAHVEVYFAHLMDSFRQALRYGMFLMCSARGVSPAGTTSWISFRSLAWAQGLRERLKITHSMLLAVCKRKTGRICLVSWVTLYSVPHWTELRLLLCAWLN